MRPLPYTSHSPPDPAPVTESGNHVADKAGDFAVWMTIDERLCRAYRGVVAEVGGKSNVGCLMGIEVGKNFQIHVDTTGYSSRRYAELVSRRIATTKPNPTTPAPPLDLSAQPDLEVRLSIDGRWIATHVIGAQARDRVTTFKGAAISDVATKAFKFTNPRAMQSPRSTNGARNPPATPPSKTSELGTIKISIHRVRKGPAMPAWIPGKLNAIKVSAGELSHHGAITCYDQPQALAQPAQYNIVRRLAEDKTTPLCCFEIAYRTADELRALGIVPVPMTPTTRPGTGRTVTYGVVSPIQGQSYAHPHGSSVVFDVARSAHDPLGSLPIGLITPRSSY